MITWKLVLSSLRHDRARALSAIAGIAAAVALLAWHVGLATTAIQQSEAAVTAATAHYSAWILGPSRDAPFSPRTATDAPPAAPPRGRARTTANSAAGGRRMAPPLAPIPPDVLSAATSSPIVQSALPLAVTSVTLDVRPGGRVRQGPPLRATVAALPDNAAALPFQAAAHSINGTIPSESSVISQADASVLPAAVDRSLLRADPSLQVGSPLLVLLPDRTETLTICAFFDTTDLVKEFPQIYVSPATYDHLFGPSSAAAPTLLLLATAPGADPADIGLALDHAGPAADACRLVTRAAVRDRFRSDTVANLLRSMPLTLSLTFLTAVALLVTILSLGLASKHRRIAELRCAGMTRLGVARLTLLESMLLILPGWLLGLLAAALLLQTFLLLENTPDLPRLVHLGWQTPLITLLFALLAGLIAAILPAIRAARIRPLEILPADVAHPRPVSLRRTLLGLLLLLPMALIGLLPAIPNSARTPLLLLLGVPLFAAGVILSLHALMRLSELLFLRPLARLLALSPPLLSRRLSRDPARARGTILTLSLGLGGFIAVHIWGSTLMSSFVPSPEWPDVIVSVLPSGYDATQAAAAMNVPGFARPARPLIASQFPADPQTAALISTRGGDPDGQLLVLGADPAETLSPGGTAPFRFLQGDRDEAIAALASGEDACIIPAITAHALRLRLGDTISIASRPLRIVGIVDLNWHMVTSRSQVRTRFGRLDAPQKPSPVSVAAPPAARRTSSPGGAGGPPAAAHAPSARRTLGMLFVSDSLARDLIGDDGRTYFFWGNFAPDLKSLPPLTATVRLDAQIRAAAGPDTASTLQVHHRDEIADGTLAHGSDILGAMARIPFWSLLVTSAGLAILLVASAQASRRELATLRALGLTRSQLARLLFGDALLVSLCSILASLLYGTLFGWSFTALGGATWSLPITFAFPFGQALRGIAFALALAFFFAALPLPSILRRSLPPPT